MHKFFLLVMISFFMGFYGSFVTRLNKLLIKTLTLNSVKTLKKKSTICTDYEVVKLGIDYEFDYIEQFL